MTQTKYLRLDDDVIEAIETLVKSTSLKSPQVINALLAQSLWLDEGDEQAPRRLIGKMLTLTGEAMLHGGRGRD